MVYETDKHSPRVDDAMRNPRQEPPTGYRNEARPTDDDEVGDQPLRRPDLAGKWPDLEGVEIRSELARFLDPVDYPAGSDRLLADAIDNDAPQWVRDALGSLPPRRYQTSQEVFEALETTLGV